VCLQNLCRNPFRTARQVILSDNAKIINCRLSQHLMHLNCYLCPMNSTGDKIFSFLFSLPIHFYRHAISPMLRPSCRHVPTCSQYALDALKIHGPLLGSYLAVNRILRCRPGGTHGYDPVPLILFKRYGLLNRYPKCNRLKTR
jgi:uncharacterized protein